MNIYTNKKTPLEEDFCSAANWPKSEKVDKSLRNPISFPRKACCLPYKSGALLGKCEQHIIGTERSAIIRRILWPANQIEQVSQIKSCQQCLGPISYNVKEGMTSRSPMISLREGPIRSKFQGPRILNMGYFSSGNIPINSRP